MNSKQIESFLCVADCLNISLSAQKMYASQSTISRQISMLEEELKVQLFVRGNNYLRLTPSGKKLCETFKELKQEFDSRYEEALILNDGEEGMLRLGLYSFMRMDFFQNIVDKTRQKYPKLHLHYECIPNGLLEPYIRDNIFDFIFLHSFDVIDSPDYMYQRLCDTHQFLLYPANHPLAKKKDLHFEDFRDEIFWCVRNRNGKFYQENRKKIFDYYGISNWKSMEAPNVDTVLFNIQMGNGCCFLDPCTSMLNNRNYRKLILDEEVSAIGINIAWNKNNVNPAIPLFVDMVTNQKEM